MNKPIGAALLVLGVLLFFFGFQEAESPAGQIGEFFTGTPPDRAMWMMIGGAVAGVLGLVMLLMPSRRGRIIER